MFADSRIGPARATAIFMVTFMAAGNLPRVRTQSEPERDGSCESICKVDDLAGHRLVSIIGVRGGLHRVFCR